MKRIFFSCALNDYLLCRKAKWIIFFIFLGNGHKTDLSLSQHLYSSELNCQKMFYLLT